MRCGQCSARSVRSTTTRGTCRSSTTRRRDPRHLLCSPSWRPIHACSSRARGERRHRCRDACAGSRTHAANGSRSSTTTTSLDPDALLDVARLVREVPDLEMVYTDQDRLRADGTIGDPAYKSAWSADLLRSTNCIVHLCCYRRSRLEALGGIREGFDGSQDYDLLLRVSDAVDATRIGHVARARYHWRASAGSVASDPEAKPWAFEAARRALADSFAGATCAGASNLTRCLVGTTRGTRSWAGRRATVVLVGDDGSALDATRASITRAGEGAVAIVETTHAPYRRCSRGGRRATRRPSSWRSSGQASSYNLVGSTRSASTHSGRMSRSQAARSSMTRGDRRSGSSSAPGRPRSSPQHPAVVADDFAWSGRVVRNLSAVPLRLAADPTRRRSIDWLGRRVRRRPVRRRHRPARRVPEAWPSCRPRTPTDTGPDPLRSARVPARDAIVSGAAGSSTTPQTRSSTRTYIRRSRTRRTMLRRRRTGALSDFISRPSARNDPASARTLVPSGRRNHHAAAWRTSG